MHGHRPPSRRRVALTAVAEFAVLVFVFAVILLYGVAYSPAPPVTW